MRENVIRSVELGVALAACYMAAVTMVQTSLYDRIIKMINDSFIGPLLGPYMMYFDLAVTVLMLALCFTLWRNGDIESFSKLFSLNMLMFFPAVLEFSTFNWVGLILDLTPSHRVTGFWVFGVGLMLQVTYLMLRYTYRFRTDREELLARGALEDDINQVSRGQMGYLTLLVSVTAVTTTVIYVAAPSLSGYLRRPLDTLPYFIRSKAHILVGITVILWIAASLILYLRDSGQPRQFFPTEHQPREEATREQPNSEENQE